MIEQQAQRIRDYLKSETAKHELPNSGNEAYQLLTDTANIILDEVNYDPVDESGLENQCVKYAMAHGWAHLKCDKISRSWPDQLFFGRGAKIFFVEFKLPTEKPRPQQWARIRMLRLLGFHVHVITDFERFTQLLASHSDPVSP